MQPEGNYVLMKAGKCMDEIHRVLETKPGVREVFSIKNCGLPGEVVKDGLFGKRGLWIFHNCDCKGVKKWFILLGQAAAHRI